MVKLLEYQGKEILRKANINTPNSILIDNVEDVEKAYDIIKKGAVIKAQLPFTGRYKIGAIKFTNNIEEAKRIVNELLNKRFKGFKPNKVLIEEKVDVKKELYLGIIINDSHKVRAPNIIFSPKGGVDIEQVAKESPELIIKFVVDYIEGLNRDIVRSELSKIELNNKYIDMLTNLILTFYNDVFIKYDARSAEINPLALTNEDNFIALDCRIVMDDHALYRHPEIKIEVPKDLNRAPTELENKIWLWEDKDPRGTGYFIQLTTETEKGGYIGFHGIGGGGAMLGADALLRKGLKLANYADTSGDPPASKIYRVTKTILSMSGIEGYILMGAVMASQEQWHHAHALVKAIREMLKDKPGFPVLIVIAGNKEKETHEIIRKGLSDLPINFELYGRDHIYKTEFIAERMKEMVIKYREMRGNE